MLRGQTVPPPFSIKDKKEALMLLVHFVGDLHQPLHVGSIYLDGDGKQVDPDIAHRVDPATFTVGGNAIQDQNVNLHSDWDDIPFDLGDAWTRELMTAARGVPKSEGTVDDWPASWASDSIQIARQSFAGLHFDKPDPTKAKWNLTYEDRTSYLLMADLIKRRQLAKAGAHLAEILNKIWP
jgi:S1/P1 Nuclease